MSATAGQLILWKEPEKDFNNQAVNISLTSALGRSSTDLAAPKFDFRSSPESGLKSDIEPCPLGADTVEKVFSGLRTKFFRGADALRSPRREGPQRLSQKRPRTFVSLLASIAAAETSKHRLSRDFGSLSIFDFFNSIGQSRSFGGGYRTSANPPRAEVRIRPGQVRNVPTADITSISITSPARARKPSGILRPWEGLQCLARCLRGRPAPGIGHGAGVLTSFNVSALCIALMPGSRRMVVIANSA